MTTGSGAEGQNLFEEFYRPDRTPPAAPEPPEDPFLARLAEVRPDLRARIAALTGRPTDPMRRWLSTTRTDFAPLFLHGYCWTRTADRIGTYGDFSRELAWVFLTSDLAPGSTFRHRLLPGLASDILLHGRITRRMDVPTEAGTFHDCLECFYLLDYGAYAFTNEAGKESGFGRTVDVGTIVYAPDVGPVQSVE